MYRFPHHTWKSGWDVCNLRQFAMNKLATIKVSFNCFLEPWYKSVAPLWDLHYRQAFGLRLCQPPRRGVAYSIGSF